MGKKFKPGDVIISKYENMLFKHNNCSQCYTTNIDECLIFVKYISYVTDFNSTTKHTSYMVVLTQTGQFLETDTDFTAYKHI